jgi:hypothetical protein
LGLYGNIPKQHQVPPGLLQKPIVAYNLLNINIEPAINLVKRVCLSVYNANGQLCIDEIDETLGDNILLQQRVRQDHINGILVQIQQTRLQLETALQAVSTLIQNGQQKNLQDCHPTSKDDKSFTATATIRPVVEGL